MWSILRAPPRGSWDSCELGSFSWTARWGPCTVWLRFWYWSDVVIRAFPLLGGERNRWMAHRRTIADVCFPAKRFPRKAERYVWSFWTQGMIWCTPERRSLQGRGSGANNQASLNLAGGRVPGQAQGWKSVSFQCIICQARLQSVSCELRDPAAIPPTDAMFPAVGR